MILSLLSALPASSTALSPLSGTLSPAAPSTLAAVPVPVPIPAVDLPTLLVVLELIGTFTFSFDGALTGARVVRLDLVGVLVLGLTTALGGGLMRDVLIGATPPASFQEWPYFAVSAAGALAAFLVARRTADTGSSWRPGRLTILVLDAVGLSLFAVVGAQKALLYGLAPAAAVILGAVTAVGGGTLRDLLIRRVPGVLTHDLYALPALLAALVTVVAIQGGWYGPVVAFAAAALCFVVRMLGVRYRLQVPATRVITN